MQIIDMKKKCDYYRIDISNNIIVGILLKRSIGLITTMFSCFKNRITYIPIDPNWPDERINTIISDNHLKMIITTKEYSDRINSAQVIVIDDRLSIEITKPIVKNEISYILYTSGSTGVPKGVEIKYDSLCNFINGISEIIDFTAGKRIACLTSVSFDIFFLESIMALEKGLTIVLANEDEQEIQDLWQILLEKIMLI